MTVIELIDYLKQFDKNLSVETCAVIGFESSEDQITREDIVFEKDKLVIYCG